MTHNNITSLKERNKELVAKNEELEFGRILMAGMVVSHCSRLNEKHDELENEIKKLWEELGKKEVFIKDLEEDLKREKINADTHLEALTTVSKKWNERKLLHWVRFALELNKEKDNLHNMETKSLEKKISNKSIEIEEKTELLVKVRGNLRKEEEKNKQLQKKSEEEKQELLELLEKTRKKLREQENQNQKLQEQLNLSNESVSKKPNKFRLFKERTTTKFRQLKEKVKTQNRELIAKVEVKVK